jgi:hypothetical protein
MLRDPLALVTVVAQHGSQFSRPRTRRGRGERTSCGRQRHRGARRAGDPVRGSSIARPPTDRVSAIQPKHSPGSDRAPVGSDREGVLAATAPRCSALRYELSDPVTGPPPIAFVNNG